LDPLIDAIDRHPETRPADRSPLCQPPALGIDFGRVIQGGREDGGAEDTSFLQADLDDAVKEPAKPGALDVIGRLVAKFHGRVWIISKASEETECKTRAWLDHHDFSTRTGLPADNVEFCRRRADNAPICQRLGITHMIDDRPDVHEAIRAIVPNCCLTGPIKGGVPARVIHTPDWAAVAEHLLTPKTQGLRDDAQH
jgi:hypothetical protein